MKLFRLMAVAIACWSWNSVEIAWAGSGAEPDPGADALQQTLELLSNPKSRSEAIKKDSNAAGVDNHVQAVAGSSENAEEMYRLAAEIFQEVVKKSGGDPQKMIEAMEKAKSDPAAFAASLSPAQRAKLTAIAKKAKPKSGAPALK